MSASALLERAAASGGRLLRVARVPAGGRPGAQRSDALRLVFDVGVVELRARAGVLAAETVEETAAGPFEDAAEEEPWWAGLGNPLVRVEELDPGPGVRLQFRPDEERPKRIALVAAGEGIDWRIEPPRLAH